MVYDKIVLYNVYLKHLWRVINNGAVKVC